MNLYEQHVKLIEQNIFINVQPMDDWNEWGYSIYMKDCMSPFFIAHNDYGFDTYESALEDGINYLKDNAYV